MRRHFLTRTAALLIVTALAACAKPAPTESVASIGQAAERYLELVLAMEPHDELYLISYFGPPEIRERAQASPMTPEAIRNAASSLRQALDGLPDPSDAAEARRKQALGGMLGALATRARMVIGDNPATFDEETRSLYGVVVPRMEAADYDEILAGLEELAPGTDPLAQRLAPLHMKQFPAGPNAALIFDAALFECRRRTLEHIQLPDDEVVSVEYVSGEPWAARTVYQGSHLSIIRINEDVPMNLDQAVQFACHEGYPGHHLQAILIDDHLVRERGWVEYSAITTYGLGGFVAEGAGNYAVDLAFPWKERLAFAREELFPLAGIDVSELDLPLPEEAERIDRFIELRTKLENVTYDATRGFLDGTMPREQVEAWLMKYHMLAVPAYASQWVSSMGKYRTTVISYGYGARFVRKHVEKEAGDDPAARWQALEQLFTRPLVPSEFD